ncbi:TonB-dependent receptor [soil metagenome]|nr:TonB-dependent receptor [Gemmatimonadota bacterium]
MLGSTGVVMAQGVTTSAVTGVVTGEQGQPASGVQIIVTNTATGATSGVISRTDGRYLLPGLQPGGPYRIEARGIGYATEAREGVMLALGQTARFDFALATAAVAIAGIDVTAERDAVISRGRTGTGAVVGQRTIERSPTITRDFTDFVRLTPQISTNTPGTSAAGRNNRYNTVRIDGAVNDDLFGLAASGTPGGGAGARPITLEAIQEFQVVLAPFDVRLGGFTGAGINAVTRSGTNDFRATASYFMRNENFVGNYVDFTGNESPSIADFGQSDLAFSAGGPIVRDRVHFFVAGEASRRSAPIGTVLGVNTNVTTESVAAVRDILVNQYGYDPGEMGAINLERESNNLFGRLDFNITPDHRLTLRHNFVDAFDDNLSRGASSYGFGRAGYVFNSTTNSTVAQLNSSLGRGFFNELRAGFTTVRDNRETGQDFPRVTIVTAQGTINAGPDNFSGRNALDQDVLEITNDLSFAVGNHNLTFGTSNQFFRFSNLFIRNPFGNYRFENIDDFRNGVASQFENSVLLPGGAERTEFPARSLSFYAQDRWDVTRNLLLTAGLRYDLSQLPQRPAYNEQVFNEFGRRTDDVPTSGGLLNPRVGFNWDVTGDQVTQVRGGVGTFSGRTPFVWISNAYGNTGLDFSRFSCNVRFGDVPPTFVADPANQPTACAEGGFTPPSEINTVDPDFRFPQVFRTSLAVDRRLPLGLIGTLEGLYTQAIHDVLYQNLMITGPTGATVEGRPQYSRRSVPGISDVIDITNTDQGWSYNLTAQVQRPFRDDWEFNAAYTFSQARDVIPGGSSQAISNWRFNITPDDPNNPPLARSRFEVPHRVLLSGSYRAAISERFPTDLSLVYIGESGQPFSYTYNGDVGGDGSFGNNLIYVPRDASEIRFRQETVSGNEVTPAQSWESFNSFIESVPCLREARGTVIQKGACREPWYNRIDVRVAQNLRTLGNQNAQVTLDILNFANLLNSDWGRRDFVSNESDSPLVLASRSQPDAQGRHEYRAFTGRNVYSIADLTSRYQIQLGVRYSF